MEGLDDPSVLYDKLKESSLEHHFAHLTACGVSRLYSLTQIGMHEYGRYGVIQVAERKRLFQLIQQVKPLFSKREKTCGYQNDNGGAKEGKDTSKIPACTLGQNSIVKMMNNGDGAFMAAGSRRLSTSGEPKSNTGTQAIKSKSPHNVPTRRLSAGRPVVSNENSKMNTQKSPPFKNKSAQALPTPCSPTKTSLSSSTASTSLGIYGVPESMSTGASMEANISTT